MNLQQRLSDLINDHRPDLSAYAWPSEASRWSELVFCVLHRQRRDDPEVTRQLVKILLASGLIEIETLSASKRDTTTTTKYILASHGWSAAQAAEAVKILQSLARAIQKHFDGKLQIAVRRFAVQMRSELGDALQTPSVTRADLDYALTHWMQNVFNLPLSLETDSLKAFCRANEVSPADLVRAADALDVNLALVDDVLEAHPSALPASKRNRKKKELRR